MNKKQLAKLLMSHPEIKALYESSSFDASDINKTIAREIMEATDSDLFGSFGVDQKMIKDATSFDELEQLEDAYLDDLEYYTSDEPNKTKQKELKELISLTKKRFTELQIEYSKELEKFSEEDIQKIAASLKKDEELLSTTKERGGTDKDLEKTISQKKSQLETAQQKLSQAKDFLQKYEEKFGKEKPKQVEPATKPAPEPKEEPKQVEPAAKTKEFDGDAWEAEIDAALKKAVEAAKAAKAARESEQTTTPSASDPEPPDEEEAKASVKLDRSKPKRRRGESALSFFLREFGNKYKKLVKMGGEDNLRDEIGDYFKVAGIDWQDTEDEPFKDLSNQDVILAIFDKQGDTYELKPELKQYVPRDLLTGEEQTFTITQDEIQQSQEEIEDLKDTIKDDMETEKMSNKPPANYNTIRKYTTTMFNNAKASIVAGNDVDMGQFTKSIATQMEELYQKFQNATQWSDLSFIVPSLAKAEGNEGFQEWQKKHDPIYRKLISNKQDDIRDLDTTEKVQAALEDSQDDTIEQQMISSISDYNSDINIDGENNDGDSEDTQAADAMNAQQIRQFLNLADDQYPLLFQFKGFVKNLATALAGQEVSPEDEENNASDDGGNTTDDESGEVPTAPDDNNNNFIDDGASTTNNSDETSEPVNERLEEGLKRIFLMQEQTEETEDNEDETEEEGSTLTPKQAEQLRDELIALKDAMSKSSNDNISAINVDDLLTDPLKAALNLETEEEIDIDENVEQQATNAAQNDKKRPSMKTQERFQAHIKTMNNFFSTKDAELLGFTEQFLLEDQSALLYGLISILKDIAGVGKQRAYNTASDVQKNDLNDDQENIQEQDGSFSGGEVEISEEDRISIKTDLLAMMKALKKLKVMISTYEENMSNVNADPALDGSSLKEALNKYLVSLQASLGKLIQRAEDARIRSSRLKGKQDGEEEVVDPQPKPNAKRDAELERQRKAAEEAGLGDFTDNDPDEELWEVLSEIMITEEDDRSERVQRVDAVYREMRLIYAPEVPAENSTGLQGQMASFNEVKSADLAERMLKLASKEDFISLFPGGMIGGDGSGIPVTVREASDAISKLISTLIGEMRDVIMLAKQETIPRDNLIIVVDTLTNISKAIQRFFNVPMKLSKETLEQIEQRLAEEDKNKSLTSQDVQPGSSAPAVDKNAPEYAGRAPIDDLIDFLKQKAFPKALEYIKNSDFYKNLMGKPEPADVEFDFEETFSEETYGSFDNEEDAINFLESIEWYSETLTDAERSALDSFLEIYQTKEKTFQESVENVANSLFDFNGDIENFMSVYEELETSKPEEAQTFANICETYEQNVGDYIEHFIKGRIEPKQEPNLDSEYEIDDENRNNLNAKAEEYLLEKLYLDESTDEAMEYIDFIKDMATELLKATDLKYTNRLVFFNDEEDEGGKVEEGFLGFSNLNDKMMKEVESSFEGLDSSSKSIFSGKLMEKSFQKNMKTLSKKSSSENILDILTKLREDVEEIEKDFSSFIQMISDKKKYSIKNINENLAYALGKETEIDSNHFMENFPAFYDMLQGNFGAEAANTLYNKIMNNLEKVDSDEDNTSDSEDSIPTSTSDTSDSEVSTPTSTSDSEDDGSDFEFDEEMNKPYKVAEELAADLDLSDRVVDPDRYRQRIAEYLGYVFDRVRDQKDKASDMPFKKQVIAFRDSPVEELQQGFDAIKKLFPTDEKLPFYSLALALSRPKYLELLNGILKEPDKFKEPIKKALIELGLIPDYENMDLQESLKPIIERMLKKYDNH